MTYRMKWILPGTQRTIISIHSLSTVSNTMMYMVTLTLRHCGKKWYGIIFNWLLTASMIMKNKANLMYITVNSVAEYIKILILFFLFSGPLSSSLLFLSQLVVARSTSKMLFISCVRFKAVMLMLSKHMKGKWHC